MPKPQHNDRRLPSRMAAAGFVAGVLLAQVAHAHEGPPFPILMDELAAGYNVSVWADPDIGDAYFYVILETPEGGRPDVVPSVAMWTEPISGRLERAEYKLKRQEMRNRLQFEAKPYFDQGDVWNVGFRIERPAAEAEEIVAQVESTPPGYGPWDLAIYLFPFLLLGGLWVVAVLRRAKAMRQYAARASGPNEHSLSEPALAASEEAIGHEPRN